MKVFIDARMFYHSGIGRYGRSLYRELRRLAPRDDFTLAASAPVRRRFAAEEKARVRFIPFEAPVYGWREQVWGGYLSWCCRRRFNVFHFPHFNVPCLLPAGVVVTCHDLIHLLFPQNFPAHKVFFARRLFERLARQARRIIVVSQCTRRDFIRFFPEAEDKLRVIHNGVDESFRPLPAADCERFKRRQALGDFLLYVGNCKAHKNWLRLIEVYAALRRRYRGLKLVFLSQDERCRGQVLKTAAAWKLEEGDVLFRSPGCRELVYYYNAAALLVLPSLYEGFGLPALEAMACGTPVVAAAGSSLPEVTGDAAVLVDPRCVDSILAAVEQVLEDSQLRDDLRRRGLARARNFSWRKTASETWRVYQEVTGEG